MSVVSLRHELGAPPYPDFEMKLPPGWVRRDIDDVTLASMRDDLKKRLMGEHKPQLFAEARALLDEQFETMRHNGVFAFFSATEQGPSTLWIPASIIASVRSAEPGETLDDLARVLIRSHGATALFGDKKTLRFEREKVVRVETDSFINQSIVYLTPIPGSRRRRALQLVAGFGRPLETPADAPSVNVTKLLFDSCVSSLRWLRS